MIRAEIFAIGVGIVGYLLHGWLSAIGAPLLFLALLWPLNAALLFRGPENMSLSVWFQGAKWALAGLLVLGMLVMR